MITLRRVKLAIPLYMGRGGNVLERTVLAITRFLSAREEGATMVEYALMVALIAAICAGIVATLGQQVLTAFTNVSGGF